jgi:ATP-binding cassette subfamily B (MDR/TAP) protein 1
VKLYTPAKGTLFIDGYPTQTLGLDWIRANVSLVQQQSVFFNESIFPNTAFGQPNYKIATKELVQMACQTALLQNAISDLPEGLETVIGSDNNLLSGGKARLQLSSPMTAPKSRMMTTSTFLSTAGLRRRDIAMSLRWMKKVCLYLRYVVHRTSASSQIR